MHHKLKNSLAGLGMVAAFIVSGLLFSQPVPADVAAPTAPRLAPSSETREAAIVLALVQVAVSLAQRELAQGSAPKTRATDTLDTAPSSRDAKAPAARVTFGMPYYSFGALLPRRRES